MDYEILSSDKSIYTRSFPKFGRPKIIGYIGLENLKYASNIRNQKVKFDLNKLIDEAKKKPPDLDVKLNDLLRFLLDNEKRLNFKPSSAIKSCQIFCYRGLMTCVACTPYENLEPWKIVAILYKGNIYLCARDTEYQIERKRNTSIQLKKCQSWGFKFEQYILADKPGSQPNPDKPVDETEEFSLVFTTNINGHNIVYGAEMDGIRCDQGTVDPITNVGNEPQKIIQYLSNKEFIELKTNRHIDTHRQGRNFSLYKTKKWWCQSFLVGIDTILCGFRNDNGIVEELKVFKVSEIPKISKHFWNPNVCFNFLNAFFTYVKRCLEAEIRKKFNDSALNDLEKLPLISLLFEYLPDASVVRVTNGYRHEDDPILPDWFLKNYGQTCEPR